MKSIFLPIAVLFPFSVFAQSYTIREISEDKFESEKKREVKFRKNERVKTINNVTIVKLKNGQSLKFVNDSTDQNFRTFKYIGDLINNKISLIRTQDYTTERYISVHLSTGDRDTLIGYPHLYNNKIVCVRGSETDTNRVIEIWEIVEEQIIMLKTFHLSGNIRPNEIMWKTDNKFIIIDDNNRIWEIDFSAK